MDYKLGITSTKILNKSLYTLKMRLRSGKTLISKSHNINFIICEKGIKQRTLKKRFNSFFKRIIKRQLKNYKIN